MHFRRVSFFGGAASPTPQLSSFIVERFISQSLQKFGLLSPHFFKIRQQEGRYFFPR